MISVYRIYLGRAWTVGGVGGELVKLFDGIPDFLYASCKLPEIGFEIEEMDAHARQAVLKIAMTQCHVAIVWAGADDPVADWTEHEIRVAQSALRRRIPILAVVPEGQATSAPVARLADRTVAWSASEIARAVIELAVEAAEKRHLGRDGTAASRVAHDAHVGEENGTIDAASRVRRLPVAEIMAAFRDLRAAR
ncbi:MAG: hypothetical protein AB7L90_12185 [Hyphomicrobiaceae bacterium]